MRRQIAGSGFTAARVALALGALPLGALALLAGCGGSSATGGSTTGGSVSAIPGSGTTDLTVVYDDGAGVKSSWHLTCDPAGGDHPDPATACAALEKGGATGLVPVPTDMMCTELYGGAQTATITGSWNGKQVQAKLNRTNGCEISRWDALSGLLPAAAGSTPKPNPTPS